MKSLASNIVGANKPSGSKTEAIACNALRFIDTSSLQADGVDNDNSSLIKFQLTPNTFYSQLTILSSGGRRSMNWCELDAHSLIFMVAPENKLLAFL